MRRMMVAVIGALPIVAFSLLPKPARRREVLQRPFPSPAVIIADEPDDNNRRDNDNRNRNRRNRDWRTATTDVIRMVTGTIVAAMTQTGAMTTIATTIVEPVIPGHWESGFLGIGRNMGLRSATKTVKTTL